MGYPDKVDAIFDQYEVNKKDSLYKIVSNLKKVAFQNKLNKFYKPVDKTEWLMPGHMFNACFDPMKNDIIPISSSALLSFYLMFEPDGSDKD